MKAINFLKEQGEVAALIDCLCHSSAGVRNWAATYLLPVKEKEAIKVLEEIVRKKIYILLVQKLHLVNGERET